MDYKNKKYCGNHLLPEKVNIFLSKFFNDECMYHDVDYSDLNGRIKSEFKFLYRMIKKSLFLLCKGLFGIPLAIIMFLGVLLFGWITYNKIKKGDL